MDKGQTCCHLTSAYHCSPVSEISFWNWIGEKASLFQKPYFFSLELWASEIQGYLFKFEDLFVWFGFQKAYGGGVKKSYIFKLKI